VRLETAELLHPERRHLVDPRLECHDSVLTQRVDAAPGVALHRDDVDEPRVAQGPQVTGHRRCRHSHPFGQLAGAARPAPEQLHDPTPRRVGERVEHRVEILYDTDYYMLVRIIFSSVRGRASVHSGPVSVRTGAVEQDVLDRLRSICLGLPETYEETAWVGTRWRVRTRTFAHVLVVNAGWPPAYARAAGSDGPITVLTFRSTGPELDQLRHSGRPFFAPPWRADEVGLVLDERVGWEEIGQLLTESYCALAPKRLRERVDRPGNGPE
jgi:YjbR